MTFGFCCRAFALTLHLSPITHLPSFSLSVFLSLSLSPSSSLLALRSSIYSICSSCLTAWAQSQPRRQSIDLWSGFLFSQWDWWSVQINIENRSNDSLQHHSPSGLEVFFPLYWFQTLFCWHKIISFEFLPVVVIAWVPYRSSLEIAIRQFINFPNKVWLTCLDLTVSVCMCVCMPVCISN